MRRFRIFVVVFLLALSQLACILQAYADYRSGLATRSVTQVADSPGDTGQSGAPTAYPQTPEEVVSGLLVASQDDPRLMVQYLSPALQQQLPPEGPLQILMIDAPIQGYSIDSAAVSVDPPLAEVNVSILAGQTELRRSFLLVQEHGFWFVQSVEALP